jgi:hypothetical protein
MTKRCTDYLPSATFLVENKGAEVVAVGALDIDYSLENQSCIPENAIQSSFLRWIKTAKEP